VAGDALVTVASALPVLSVDPAAARLFAALRP